jgi:hypothetical protein
MHERSLITMITFFALHLIFGTSKKGFE